MDSGQALELLAATHNIEALMQVACVVLLAILFFSIVGALTRWKG